MLYSIVLGFCHRGYIYAVYCSIQSDSLKNAKKLALKQARMLGSKGECFSKRGVKL